MKDKKRNAGASRIIRRNLIKTKLNNPPYVETNVAIPAIPVGKQTLYFSPDKLLVFEVNGVGAVSYSNLDIVVELTRFIEDGTVPSDAKIVDSTWKYVNKNGSPDKRFNDNRELPIALYEDINFTSTTSLNERIKLSRVGIADRFRDALIGLATHA